MEMEIENQNQNGISISNEIKNKVSFRILDLPKPNCSILDLPIEILYYIFKLSITTEITTIKSLIFVSKYFNHIVFNIMKLKNKMCFIQKVKEFYIKNCIFELNDLEKQVKVKINQAFNDCCNYLYKVYKTIISDICFKYDTKKIAKYLCGETNVQNLNDSQSNDNSNLTSKLCYKNWIYEYLIIKLNDNYEIRNIFCTFKYNSNSNLVNKSYVDNYVNNTIISNYTLGSTNSQPYGIPWATNTNINPNGTYVTFGISGNTSDNIISNSMLNPDYI